MRVLLLIVICILPAGAFCQYNFYFGNIHSHSSYSDGNKDSASSHYYYPGQDFYFAKSSYHLDFLGIAEHNHYTANNNPGMHRVDYAKGLAQADTSNNDGTFVSMFGMEWGVIANGGHVVTYGVPGLIGWETGSGAWGSSNNYDIYCAKSDYTSLWPIVNSYSASNAFCTLAHPQPGDYSDLAGALPYSTVADNAIVGVAIRSGSAFSTTTDYSDPAPTLYEWYYLAALAKGYHVGPTADQDNHNTTFGRTSKIRTVVLAQALKRDSIIAAYRAMRFYASDDWNAQVTFTVNGNYMGSDISTNSNSSIFVSVSDPDVGDNVDSIIVYSGSPGSGINATMLASSKGSSTLTYTHSTVQTNQYYYFAKIKQTDGDIIWTAPVWVYRNAVALPVTISKFEGHRVNKEVDLNWTTAQEINNDHFEIEHSLDGINYRSIGRVNSKLRNTSLPTDYTFSDLNPANGMNFYRLKQVNADSKFSYSDVVAIKFDNPVVDALTINPNPVGKTIHIVCDAIEATAATCNIYNSEGRLVKSIVTNFIQGSNIITADVSSLSSGTYFVVLSRPNERMAEGKFVKE
jgi:hypothetical protein